MTEKQLKVLKAYIAAAIAQKTSPSPSASVDLYCAEGDLQHAFKLCKRWYNDDRETT